MSVRQQWNLHHATACCQVCDWVEHQEGPGSCDIGSLLRLARRHHHSTGHYVQVERAEHLHYETTE